MRHLQGGDGGREGRLRAAVSASVPLGVRAGVAAEAEHVPVLPARAADRGCAL